MQKIYSRIDWENEPSTNTPLSESNLNKMDYALDQIDNRVVQLAGYQDRVAQSEKNAKTSETNAKTSETNAKQSELKAKEYMESAFKGTPEGYQEVVEKVDRMEIKTTKENTNKGTKHGGFRLTKFLANTIQNGTPSPITPIPMLSTGDCVEMVQGRYGVNGSINVDIEHICSANHIPCKAGDVVKVVYGTTPLAIGLGFFDENNNLLSAPTVENTNICEGTAPAGTKYVIYNIKGNGITPYNADKITLTINGKYVTCIKTQGKNFANPTRNTFVSRLGGVIASKTGFDYVATASGTAQVVNMYIPIKENTDYAFSFKDKGYVNAFGLTFVDSIGTWTNITNKVKSGNSGVHKYALLSWQLDAGYSGTISVYDVQLEVGTETDFEEYRETTAYILTNEPPRLGDIFYKENGLWKLEHNTTERTLTVDNANWRQSTTAGLEDIFFTQTYKTDYVYPQYPLCDRFSQSNTTTEFLTNHCSIDATGSLWFRHGNINTLDGFKAWITENPIRVQYRLATPIIEVLDTASQIALNGLETFEGVTYVEFDSRVQPLEFEAEVGTSQMTARLLKEELRNDTDQVERAELKKRLDELAVAIVALRS